MQFDWPYYTLRNGWLVDADGRCPFQKEQFPSDWTSADAERWLEENDIRGTVR